MNTSSKAAPLRKGMLIFLSSLPHEPFCFEFKTTLSQPSKRGLKWKATSAPWPCPTSKFTKNLAGHGGLYPWLHSKGQFPIATPSLTPCPYEKSFPHPVSNRTTPGTPAFAPTNLNLSVQVSLSPSPVPEAHSPRAARGTLSSVQLLSPVQLFATPWTAACQASLCITNSWSVLKLMSMESVMPSNHFKTQIRALSTAHFTSASHKLPQGGRHTPASGLGSQIHLRHTPDSLPHLLQVFAEKFPSLATLFNGTMPHPLPHICSPSLFSPYLSP